MDNRMNADIPVLIETRGHTLVITINRPEARNRVDVRVHMAVGEALRQADADGDIRSVILTGAGDVFCAGADLQAVARGESLLPEEPVARSWGFAGFVTHPISKPTIAAVNGAALGGGMELVLASDLAVASRTARFGLTQVKWGFFASEGGAIRLPEHIPAKIAMELILTGGRIGADEAYQLGLITRIAEPAEVVSTALALADRINQNAPLAIAASKAVARGIVDGAYRDEASRASLAAHWQEVIGGSADFHEGVAAFNEHRTPHWTGR